MLADLVGGDDEGLVLDRPGAQQDLPVVARGGEVNAAGTVITRAPRTASVAVELGEAQVVTDAQAQLDAAGVRRDDDLVAGLLGVRLAVAASRRPRRRTCAACGRRARTSPSGPTCTQVLTSRSRPASRSDSDPATRSMPSSRATARAQRRAPARRAARRRRAGCRPGPAPATSPAARPARRRRPPRRARVGRPLRGCGPCPSVELSWMAAARSGDSPLIDSSVKIAAMPVGLPYRSPPAAPETARPDPAAARAHAGMCAAAVR